MEKVVVGQVVVEIVVRFVAPGWRTTLMRTRGSCITIKVLRWMVVMVLVLQAWLGKWRLALSRSIRELGKLAQM